MLTWGRERLAHMEEVFPGDPGDEVTGAGLEVNCGQGRVGELGSAAIVD
jgi:hypothetical protein